MSFSSCLRASLPLWKVFALSLLAIGQAPAAEPAKPGLAAKVHEFKFPKSACYHCLDQEEAERRWRLAQEMATADLYELRSSSSGASPTMTPLLKSAVVKFISGGSGPDGMMGLGLNVTEKQRASVEAAIAKKQLLVIYYHYGW